MIVLSSSWDIGEWSECSKTCGLGMQHRQILCRQFYINRTLTVHAKLCERLERPESSSTCQLKICSEWQIRSEWTSVSDRCQSHHSLHSGGKNSESWDFLDSSKQLSDLVQHDVALILHFCAFTPASENRMQNLMIKSLWNVGERPLDLFVEGTNTTCCIIIFARGRYWA